MGETLPEIPCLTRECTEEEHERNRRAEFVLRGANRAADNIISDVQKNDNSPKTNNVVLGYQDILDKYGDNKVANLKLKIALGVYRLNSSLTFDDLKDLGRVEAVNVEGATYYFLSEFFTMNEAEAARKKVAQRGVEDAYIMFYYNNENVKIQDLMSLLQ